MLSRDQKDPLVYSAPKSKETRNKILAWVNNLHLIPTVGSLVIIVHLNVKSRD